MEAALLLALALAVIGLRLNRFCEGERACVELAGLTDALADAGRLLELLGDQSMLWLSARSSVTGLLRPFRFWEAERELFLSSFLGGLALFSSVYTVFSWLCDRSSELFLGTDSAADECLKLGCEELTLSGRPLLMRFSMAAVPIRLYLCWRRP
jgi:hypothetical protein